MKYIPHPSVQIFIWILLALLVQHLQPLALFLLCAVLLAMALGLCAEQLLSLLRRTRWIICSLLLIYAYSTPGQTLLPQFGFVSPTREGLLDGVMQLGRLLSVLSGLAILLSLLTQSQLIGGLHMLAYPLRWCGLSRERIAVRLALTLSYAESAMRDTASDWRTSMAVAMRSNPGGAMHIELYQQPFSLGDAAVLSVSTAVLIGIWQ